MMTIKLLYYIANLPYKRTVSTSFIVNERFSRKTRYSDPGIKRRIGILEENDSFKYDLEDEEDLAALETDFENVDKAYTSHKREQKWKREQISRIITAKKYFSGPIPPNMLTWAEREQIKYLHNKDPEQWSVEVLSDSFPATTETIRKILKTKWKFEDAKKMARRDERVHENWRLLSEGSLEAEPEMLNHFKKFLVRREEQLKSLQTVDFKEHLKLPEPNIRWNNGQMSSILESYEKQMIKLEEKKRKRLGLTSAKSSQSNDVGSTDKKALSHIQEGNILETNTMNKRTPMNFDDFQQSTCNEASVSNGPKSLGKDLSHQKDSVTMRIAKLAGYSDSDRQGLPHSKKVKMRTLEPKLQEHLTSENSEFHTTKVKAKMNVRESLENSPGTLSRKTVGHEKNEKQVIDEICPPTFLNENNEIEFNVEDRGNFIKKEKAESMQSDMKTETISEVSKSREQGNIKNSEFNSSKMPFVFDPPKEDGDSVSDQINPEAVLRENDTMELTADNIGRFLRKDMDDLKETGTENKPDLQVKKDKKPFLYDTTRDDEQFANEASSIEGTFFWSGVSSDVPATREEKPLIPTNSKSQLSALYDYGYPEKIKIPKDQQGSGLTFRVNDCYYDDDGEFLYRVPGFTAKTSSET